MIWNKEILGDVAAKNELLEMEREVDKREEEGSLSVEDRISKEVNKMELKKLVVPE